MDPVTQYLLRLLGPQVPPMLAQPNMTPELQALMMAAQRTPAGPAPAPGPPPASIFGSYGGGTALPYSDPWMRAYRR